MKKILTPTFYKWFSIVALVVGLAIGGWYGFQFGKALYAGAAQGNAAYMYLTQEVGKDEKGQPIMRAAVLDAIIKQVAEQSKQAQPVAQPAPAPTPTPVTPKK